ncbi:hypothetical protein QUF74_03890 [Candidatus Halobeggiatoa sp. HSG11]|nr:hypothetical protein [Candidatus Halobeggiatoa sp. HSG11]
MNNSILKKDKRYSFSDYFYMNNPTEEIITELGYSLEFAEIQFPSTTNIENTTVENIKNIYYKLLPKITLNSEIAKREFMIAPLLHQVILNIDDKLNGYIDYLIRSKQELIVIEAKKGDLERGFNQLAAEMIALDQYETSQVPEILYGAITIGEVWRFAQLKRLDKTLVKDINLFKFPQDTKELLVILTGILAT